jgi:shikimate dehydrogenase
MTIKAGLIGYPLKKSLSPRLFGILTSGSGEKYSYALCETRGSGMARTLEKIKAGGWAGFNVTLPLKEHILPLLDSLSPEARAIGAVNAVRIRNGKSEGHNTDVVAIKLALKEAGCRIRGRRCVIWGAGGAARAAAWTLVRGGAKTIEIHNRSLSAAEDLVKDLSGLFPHAALTAGRLTDIPGEGSTLFINATPLGMYKPLPSALRFKGVPGSFYLDLAYAKRGLTPFLKNRTGRVISGVDLLIYQALKSSELYGGRRIAGFEIVKLKNRIKAQLLSRRGV